MALLFLDLEFNQGNSKAKYFEIIQISVVKTDLFWEQLCLFDRYIEPKLANIVHSDVVKLTGIRLGDLKKRGIPFERCIKQIKECVFKGDVTHILTWGDSDVGILKSNCIKNNIDYSFLDGIEVIDIQQLYMFLNELEKKPSLHKTTSDMKFCKEHDGLHDVYRLIQVSKEIGLKNIINSKSILKKHLIKSSFGKARKMIRKNNECLCGEGRLSIFLDSNINSIGEDKYRKTYLVKCNSCNYKYKAIVNSKVDVKSSSWIESMDKIDDLEYFNEVDKIIKGR